MALRPCWLLGSERPAGSDIQARQYETETQSKNETILTHSIMVTRSELVTVEQYSNQLARSLSTWLWNHCDTLAVLWYGLGQLEWRSPV